MKPTKFKRADGVELIDLAAIFDNEIESVGGSESQTPKTFSAADATIYQPPWFTFKPHQLRNILVLR